MSETHHHHQQCIELFSRLSEFIDGELELPLQRAMEQHLAECKACRVCLATLKRTIALCRHIDRPPLPAAVSRRLAEMVMHLQKEKGAPHQR